MAWDCIPSGRIKGVPPLHQLSGWSLLTSTALHLSFKACCVFRQGGQCFLYKHREQQAAISQEGTQRDSRSSASFSKDEHPTYKENCKPRWISKSQSSLLSPTPHRPKLIITGKWLPTGLLHPSWATHSALPSILCDVTGSTLWSLGVSSPAPPSLSKVNE